MTKPKISDSYQSTDNIKQLIKDFDGEIDSYIIKNSQLTEDKYDNISFSNIGFSNCEFMECVFEKCSFTDCIFTNCNLSNSHFANGFFNRVVFEGTKCLGADFNQGRFYDVSVQGCNFRYSNLTMIHCDKFICDNSDFTQSFLSQSRLKNVTFENSKFTGTDFFETKLTGIDFSSCEIDGLVVSDSKSELKGMITNSYQAASLAKLLGVIVK